MSPARRAPRGVRNRRAATRRFESVAPPEKPERSLKVLENLAASLGRFSARARRCQFAVDGVGGCRVSFAGSSDGLVALLDLFDLGGELLDSPPRGGVPAVLPSISPPAREFAVAGRMADLFGNNLAEALDLAIDVSRPEHAGSRSAPGTWLRRRRMMTRIATAQKVIGVKVGGLWYRTPWRNTGG